MTESPSVASRSLPAWLVDAGPRSPRNRMVRIALLAVWAALTLYLAANHVFWRDEVRALHFALKGDGVIDMIRALQGEGHPALWYLLLRGGQAILPLPAVLPGVAFVVGAAAMTVFALRAPFRLPVIAFVLFGAFGVFEFVVMARNYGITMLILVLYAAWYPRGRTRGIVPGLLILALCNTNAQAIFLGGGLMLCWLIERLGEDDWCRIRSWRGFATAGVLSLIGVAACVLEVYPPWNDGAVAVNVPPATVANLLRAAVNVGEAMVGLFPDMAWHLPHATILATILIVLAPFGLLHRPGAFVPAMLVMIALTLFFQRVYPGGYRHQALFLVFLVTLYWMVARGGGGHWPARCPSWAVRVGRPLRFAGTGAFYALLALQVPTSAAIIADTMRGIPYSHSRDVADLIRRERLEDAILIGQPDVMIEAIPYYIANPTYLMREHKFGRVVRFTRHAQLRLSLGDVLAKAQSLHTRTGRPIVIVYQGVLDPNAPARVADQDYVGTYSSTPDQTRAFLAAMRRIARLRTASSDERYDIYVLDTPRPTG